MGNERARTSFREPFDVERTQRHETTMPYRSLDPGKIVASLEQLERRIAERFPKAGLAKVCAELAGIAREHSERAAAIGQRNWPLRLAVVVVLGGCSWLLWRISQYIDFSRTAADSVYSVLQGIEATMNIVVLMGAAVFFLVSVEDRIKRRRALQALHELRSIVHVVDMHQLTKDPSSLIAPGPATSSSPRRTFTPFELTRYLDYCSEMLSLAGKVGALYAQGFPDPIVADAVGDLERLTTNLSQKIWAKINIVEQMVANAPRTSVPVVPAPVGKA